MSNHLAIHAAAISIVLSLAAQTAEADARLWSRCMHKCQNALDRDDPYAEWWRMQWSEYRKGWLDQNGRLREFTEEEQKKLKGYVDKGRSLEQFKTCLSLCK